MTTARTIGMTTAKATGRVTLFESEGFWPEELVESRLRTEESLAQGVSIKRCREADCGSAMALGSLLFR